MGSPQLEHFVISFDTYTGGMDRTGGIRALVVCLAMTAAATSYGGVGDTIELTLRSGETVSGTVVRETKFKYVIETTISGITFEKTVAKSDVKRAEVLEALSEKELEALREAAVPNREATSLDTGGYAIVPAKGGIGQELTAGFFEDALERATRDEAELVVFHLESPGGYVSCSSRSAT